MWPRSFVQPLFVVFRQKRFGNSALQMRISWQKMKSQLAKELLFEAAATEENGY